MQFFSIDVLCVFERVGYTQLFLKPVCGMGIEDEDTKLYLSSHAVHKLVDAMIMDLVREKPAAPIPYLLSWLQASLEHVETMRPHPGEPHGCPTHPTNGEEYVALHNKYRRMHGVPDLQWCDKAANAAKEWVKQGEYAPSNSEKYGENLYATSSDPEPDVVVGSWYSGVEGYDFQNPGTNPRSGSFTQTVWKNTKRIGCATSVLPNGRYMVVCYYDPPGNYYGKFASNVFPKNDHPIPQEEGSPLCPTIADREQDPPLVALLDSMGPLEDVPLVDCGPLCLDPAVLSTPNDTVEFLKSTTEVMIDLLKLTSDTPTGAQGVADVLLSEKEVALPLSLDSAAAEHELPSLDCHTHEENVLSSLTCCSGEENEALVELQATPIALHDVAGPDGPGESPVGTLECEETSSSQMAMPIISTADEESSPADQRNPSYFLCDTPFPAIPEDYIVRFIPTNEEEFVAEHNRLRVLHGAPPLRWSPEVAASAAGWARRGLYRHSDAASHGENLYVSSDPPPAEYVVPSWYSEIRWYDFRAPVPEERTGHFTQVVWAATEEIGCATCCLPNGRFMVVCHYSPPGNFIGKFDANVRPPKDPVVPHAVDPHSPPPDSVSTHGDPVVQFSSTESLACDHICVYTADP